MNRSKKIDMTTGPIMKNIILFALPITMGNILQMLYSIVDTLVVGNFCGSESLAAVGTSGQPVEILLCIFMGLGSGVSILVSQNMGRGNVEQLKKVTATAVSFLYLCAIPLTILGFFLCPLILRLIQVPEEAFDYAVSYTRIIFLATLGNIGYNMNAGILRGIGDSASSIYFLLISSITNIVLDLVFVVFFQMDVTGVALATAIAMYASWLFSAAYIRQKHDYIGFTFLPKTMNKEILKEIIQIGLPLGLNNSLYSVGHLLMQTLNNAQGYTFVAACSVATKITGIANMTIRSFASAATTFAGQNFGAKNYKRLQKGGFQIPFYSGIITCVLGLFFTLMCRPILSLFTPDLAVLELAVLYIRIVLPFTWCFSVLSCINNFANGLGAVTYPMIINLLMLFAVRIPSAYAIHYFIDGQYIMAATTISYIFGLIAMLFFYRSRKWKEIKTQTS